MKALFLFLFAFISTAVYSQSETNEVANPNYDAELAERLGADDFGMKPYFLVMLKTGSNTAADDAFRSECFRGHMENIGKLVEQDVIIVAGPLGKNDQNYRGIFILDNVATPEAADSLLQTDPAISNNLLGYDLLPWYGSAALPEYLPASDKIWKVEP